MHVCMHAHTHTHKEEEDRRMRGHSSPGSGGLEAWVRRHLVQNVWGHRAACGYCTHFPSDLVWQWVSTPHRLDRQKVCFFFYSWRQRTKLSRVLRTCSARHWPRVHARHGAPVSKTSRCGTFVWHVCICICMSINVWICHYMRIHLHMHENACINLYWHTCICMCVFQCHMSSGISE